MNDDLHIYVRVSSEIQKTEGFGLETQIELGEKVSKSLGMNPIIHNEGSKSSNSDEIEDRPFLMNLMREISEGNVKNVWCYNNDRLSRNESVWFTIRRQFKLNDVTLFVGEGTKYDLSSHMDDFMFGIISEVTKYDNKLRTERLKRGRLQKLKDGDFWKGGPPPFGYSIEDKRLVVHPTESKWVKVMYEEYSKGTSISHITDLLIKNRVKSRRGNVIFSKESVLKILQNTHYEGYYLYTDKTLNESIKVGCPSILSPKLVKMVRDRLEKRVKTSNYVKTPTLLKSLFECDHCGSGFGQRINKSQYYNHYYCMGNTQRFKKEGKSSPKVCLRSDGGRVRSLNIEDTDDIVWSLVVEVLSDSHLFKENFKSKSFSDQTTFGDFRNEQKNLKNRIKKKERDLDKLNKSFDRSVIDSLINDNMIESDRNFLKGIEDKKNELRIEIGELNDRLFNSEKTQNWVDWRKDFDDDIGRLKGSDLTIKEKSNFLNSTIRKIGVTTVDNQTHSLQIEFILPYVNDQLVWNDPNKKSKGYRIVEGEHRLLCSVESTDKRQKKTKGVTEIV